MKGAKTIVLLCFAAICIYYMQVSSQNIDKDSTTEATTTAKVKPSREKSDFLVVAAKTHHDNVQHRHDQKAHHNEGGSSPDVPPAPPAPRRHACCDYFERGQQALFVLPSDIMYLLPILYLYLAEPDVNNIIEAGSRFGSSTATLLKACLESGNKRCATIDPSIFNTVTGMYKCAKACSASISPKYDPAKDFVFFAQNDLTVPIPFCPPPCSGSEASVDKVLTSMPKSSTSQDGHYPIDAMFIDTAHNGDLLTMELKRYSPLVRKYMLFHDSYSYLAHDEYPQLKVPQFDELGIKKLRGLKAAFTYFLKNNADWEEEMNNPHNNGLFILRRKAAVPQLPSVMQTGLRIEDLDTVKKIMASPSEPEKGANITCIASFNAIVDEFKVGGNSNGLCVDWRLNHRLTSVLHAYLHLSIMPDSDVAIARYMPLLMSYAVALGLNQGTGLFIGCELSPFVAFLHGALYSRGGIATFLAYDNKLENPDADSAKQCPSGVESKFESLATKVTDVKNTVSLAMISASRLRGAPLPLIEKLANVVKSRIVVYGVSIANIESSHEVLTKAGWQLKSVLSVGVGVAMYERKTSRDFLYVPDLKPTSSPAS